jgi:hypothetical protein
MLLDGVAAHEPEERAVAPVGPLRLVDERQVALVELAEPLVPVDVFQPVRPGAAGEVDGEQAGCVAEYPRRRTVPERAGLLRERGMMMLKDPPSAP